MCKVRPNNNGPKNLPIKFRPWLSIGAITCMILDLCASAMNTQGCAQGPRDSCSVIIKHEMLWVYGYTMGQEWKIGIPEVCSVQIHTLH